MKQKQCEQCRTPTHKAEIRSPGEENGGASMMPQQREVILYSAECRCGRWKKPGFAVCISCNFRLSLTEITELFKTSNPNFTEAYEVACRLLDAAPRDIGRISREKVEVE